MVDVRNEMVDCEMTCQHFSLHFFSYFQKGKSSHKFPPIYQSHLINKQNKIISSLNHHHQPPSHIQPSSISSQSTCSSLSSLSLSSSHLLPSISSSSKHNNKNDGNKVIHPSQVIKFINSYHISHLFFSK